MARRKWFTGPRYGSRQACSLHHLNFTFLNTPLPVKGRSHCVRVRPLTTSDAQERMTSSHDNVRRRTQCERPFTGRLRLRVMQHLFCGLQPLSVGALGQTRDLRRCVTSPPSNCVAKTPPSNGVAKKIASNGKLAAATGPLRGDEVVASVRRGWLPSEVLDAPPVDNSSHVSMFVKNSRVKFHLGHDDEQHDVITCDVTATI